MYPIDWYWTILPIVGDLEAGDVRVVDASRSIGRRSG